MKATSAQHAIETILRGEHRTPLALITNPGRDAPTVSVPELTEFIGDEALVLVVESDPWIDAVNQALPEKVRTFGHAVRLLPPPHLWCQATLDLSRYAPLKREYDEVMDRVELALDKMVDAEALVEKLPSFRKPVRPSSPAAVTAVPGPGPDSLGRGRLIERAPAPATIVPVDREDLINPADRAEMLDLVQKLREAEHRNERSKRRIAGLVAENKKLKARPEVQQGIDREAIVFLDPVRQFQHEVFLAWAQRIPATDKDAYPLATVRLAESFLPSLEQIQGISRSKVVDVVAEVACGLAFGSASRSMKQMPGVAKDPVLGQPWRVRLQIGTPNARRLLAWRADDGSWTLDSVKAHDDFETEN